jgi:thymidylate synthase
MLHTYSGVNLQDMFKTALYELMTEGMVASPRGMETKELTPVVFEVKNILSRMISLKSRKMNPFYGIIETLWYMNGDNDVKRLTPYNKAMANFSDDGNILAGAYGERLVGKNRELDKSQFGLVYDKLTKDPSSRQAIAIIWDPWRDYAPTKDVPCTVGFMFTIRNEKLNMTTIMRSNDIVLGTTYDVFAFTIFQEFLARKLGVGLGTYTHLANSFHIYSNHYDKAWEMIKDNTPAVLMPEMPDTSWKTFNELYDFERRLITDEIDLTTAQQEIEFIVDAHDGNQYWADWARMLALHKAIKLGDTEKVGTFYSALHSSYQAMTLPWVEKLI